MTKSLVEFNRDYDYKCFLEEKMLTTTKKDSLIKKMIFYSTLIIIVVFSIFWSNSNDAGKRFGSFSYNTVLTSSMQSIYPQGSLVTSWAITPNEPLKTGLAEGDDIVFVTESGKRIVHRIIEIMENYEDSGFRAFRTQGVENIAPDSFITYEGNVIGRVTWHVPYVGGVLTIINENIFLFIAGISVICVLIPLLKISLANNTLNK